MHLKHRLHHTYLLISLVLCAFTGVGQGIDEIDIIPEGLITTEDEVSVRVTAWHPTQGCPIVETEFFYNQDTITVVVEHELGLATAICNSIDTTSLGSYAPGTYKVEYVMISGGFGDFAVTDTAYTEFTVEGVNSIGGLNEKSKFSVYPNPSTGSLYIETDWRGQVAVYDLMGKEVDRFRIDRSPFLFSTREFTQGFYFLAPLDKSDVGGGKFVVR